MLCFNHGDKPASPPPSSFTAPQKCAGNHALSNLQILVVVPVLRVTRIISTPQQELTYTYLKKSFQGIYLLITLRPLGQAQKKEPYHFFWQIYSRPFRPTLYYAVVSAQLIAYQSPDLCSF